MSFCQISPISMSRRTCHVSRAVRYCVTRTTIGECPSTSDITKAITATRRELGSFAFHNPSFFINHSAPRHRVWNASIEWEMCYTWLHLDIHHPLLRVEGLILKVPLRVISDVIKLMQKLSAEDASICFWCFNKVHKSSVVLWSWVQIA